jgi:TRAP transporter TAXI family solute receptor
MIAAFRDATALTEKTMIHSKSSASYCATPRRMFLDALAGAAVFLTVFTSGAAAGAEQTGFAVNKPMVAAACPSCPWGAVADVMTAIMKPRGYDLVVCYYCSGIPNPRLVSGAMKPSLPRPDRPWLPRVPADAPLDMGVTNVHRLKWAYEGTFDYAKEPPRRNLRAIALIEHPTFLAIAARAQLGISDLRQIRERKIPARIMVTENPFTLPILEYYGVTRKDLESWGGSFKDEDADRTNFDVIIHNQLYMSNAPEAQVWSEVAQKENLIFLPLPEDLARRLANELTLQVVDLPGGLIRGADTPLRTVARSGQVIYGRTDMPEHFAYTLAKALDEESRRFIWTSMPLSYNPDTVWHTLGVPLHPGAERYYREKGYIK